MQNIQTYANAFYGASCHKDCFYSYWLCLYDATMFLKFMKMIQGIALCFTQ